MAFRVPSFEFFQALSEADGRGQGVTGVEGLQAMLLLNLGEQVLTVEIEGSEYLGVARGGNPNDVDFQLSAPEEVWRDLFHTGAGGDVGRWVGPDGRINLEAPDAEAEEIFRRVLPVIEDFFGRAKQLELEAS